VNIWLSHGETEADLVSNISGECISKKRISIMVRDVSSSNEWCGVLDEGAAKCS